LLILKRTATRKAASKCRTSAYEQRLKLRKIGLTNDWTPYAARTLAYMAKFDTRYKDKHYEMVNFFSFEPVR
jgi:hypothetical protein